MDWALKAVLTATMAALVVLAGRRCGRRAGGLLAGLPVLTGPGLVWIASEQGAVHAAGAAAASVAACGALAAFAFAYARSAARHGVIGSLACALASAIAVGLVAHQASRRLDLALAFALIACAAALLGLPQATGRADARRSSAGELTLTSGGAGLVAAFATHAAPWLGTFGAGMALSLPVISAGAVALEHRVGGAQAATRFLKGYVGGLFSRAIFCTVFAVTVVPLGPGHAAAAGVVMALATAFVMDRSGSGDVRRPGRPDGKRVAPRTGVAGFGAGTGSHPAGSRVHRGHHRRFPTAFQPMILLRSFRSSILFVLVGAWASSVSPAARASTSVGASTPSSAGSACVTQRVDAASRLGTAHATSARPTRI